MTYFPILHSNGKTIPYKLVKQHEKQVMKNHGGQTVDEISKRGGLDYIELYCVLNNKEFDSKIDYDLAKIKINNIIEGID